jgi:hypothetical protein
MSSTGGVLVLHGGNGGNKDLADTWQWVNGVWSKVQEMGPSARHYHASAYDSDRQKIVLFGGHYRPSSTAEVQYFGDTWEAPGNSSPGSGGSGPDNLTVTPDTVSLTSRPIPAIQFDIASELSKRTYLIFLEDAAGSRQPVGDGRIPPGVTRLSQAVRAQWFTNAVNVLGLALPANAWLTTDLGSSRVALRITA